MKTILLAVIFQAGVVWHPALAAQTISDSPEVVAARKARDRASIEKLQKAIALARKEVAATNGFEAYLRLALFEVWLCEAAETRNNDELFKQAAEAGVAAAEKAVELNPQSSDAHQLLGDLISQLIPHVFGGGMRYGKRSTEELDKAIELNPKNINAYVSRAISYYYTPESFGGSKAKAFEMLKKAVEIDPLADSPHIWLAQFHLDADRLDDALREIKLAQGANPGRLFTIYVYSQVRAAMKKNGVKKSPPTKNTRLRKQDD
jgi:tetratricopeptide (TPR) repeat protein